MEIALLPYEVRPRQQTPIRPDAPLYVATGGEGSPAEDRGQPWLAELGRLVDRVLAGKGSEVAPRLFAICYSFEAVVQHLALGELRRLPFRHAGLHPMSLTEAGRAHPVLSMLGQTFYAFEHRSWEVVNVDETRLAAIGGAVLAHAATGAVMALALPGIVAVQFHPELTRAEIGAHLADPGMAGMLRALYGDEAYEDMVRRVADPSCRVADRAILDRWSRA